MAVTIFEERKISEQALFFKGGRHDFRGEKNIHSALTISLTENLHEYKIVERKMAHLLYLCKLYLALLV